MAQRGSGAVLRVGTANASIITTDSGDILTTDGGDPLITGSVVTISITGITQANPAVVTATNTFVGGEVIVITDVVGMTSVNNRAFVVANPTSTTFELKGINSTNYPAYVSDGELTEYLMTIISQPTQLTGFDGQASEIDTASSQSHAKEFLLGLQDFGSVSLKMLLVNTDLGQQVMRAIKEIGTPAPFTLTLASGEVAAWMGLVKQLSFDGVQPEGALGGNAVIRVTNAPAWFA